VSRIKLADWARDNGITYVTAWRWWNAGQLPGIQLPTGTILIDTDVETNLEKPRAKRAAVYARVSHSENRSNAETQAERVTTWAVLNGYEVCSKTVEIGSGLNDSRKKLNALLSRRDFDVIIVEHKDRLTRFGFEYIRLFLESYGKEIVVINEVDDDEADLMQDFVSLVTSFCARLYGRRRSKRITEKLIEEAARD
jgi:putative resolvase